MYITFFEVIDNIDLKKGEDYAAAIQIPATIRYLSGSQYIEKIMGRGNLNRSFTSLSDNPGFFQYRYSSANSYPAFTISDV